MYPEGGGQPADTGTFKIAEPDLGQHPLVPVLNATKGAAGEVLHLTKNPVAPGQHVTVDLDWARRFDHMQQHTGQHLLSAVVQQVLGAKTTSWELHPLQIGPACNYRVSIDLSVATLTPDQLRAIEAKCNEHIRAAHNIKQLLLSSNDNSVEALTARDIFRGVIPSADAVQGPIRLVEMEGLDLNACGGTHLSCTSQLQVLKLLGCEKNKGLARLHFMVGGRVLATCDQSLEKDARLNKALRCGPAEHVAQVLTLQSSKQALARDKKALLQDLATFHGRHLVNNAEKPGGVAMMVKPGVGLDFLSLVAKEVCALDATCVVLLLAPQADADQDCIFLLSGPSRVVEQASKGVMSILKGKGGGRSGRLQGKATGFSESLAKEALAHVRSFPATLPFHLPHRG